MHPYILALILGVIEGLTEFLPVSSTAHLRIAQSLLGIALDDGYWKMFAIVIQLGAILTLPIYFRERIAKFLRTFPNGERGERTVFNHPLTLVCVAFVCTAAPAFLLTKVIGKHLESLVIMGASLVIGGIIMWVVDALYAKGILAGKTTHVEEMSLGQAIWIGLCQTLSAVFPGTSRSMSTIAAGQLAGMDRSSALEFSFFLSIPTMVVATAYDLFKSLRPHHGEPAAIGNLVMNASHWITLFIGFAVSFVVAYGVVAWFMNWVRKRGFAPFALYRILVGAAVLWVALKG
ncbi:MAG: undecaprenyl-diphosphate phosphatase [Acidobacteriota bacterium]|nr:undecaprenyl-diphosphate phosphatase [Acidobacteriota bacterium]